MNDILQANNIIKSKRQPHNLKRLLTRAKLDVNIQIATENKCSRPNCGLCKCMIVGNSFSFKCGETFYVITSMGCDAKNLIYVMQCTAGFPQALEIMENLENHQKSSMHRQIM